MTPFFVVFLREVSKASEAQVISGEVLRPTHTTTHNPKPFTLQGYLAHKKQRPP